MFNVIEEESAKGLWEKLEKLYMGKNLTNNLHLKKQLYGLKMEEGCDLMEHMNTFNRMISDLLRLDVKFDDEDRALLLLNSLSDPYEHFVTTLLCGKETLNFEEVSKDEKNKAGDKSESSDSVSIASEKEVELLLVLQDNKGKKLVKSRTEASTSGGEEEVEVQQEPTSLAQGRVTRNTKPPQRFGWDEDEVHFALPPAVVIQPHSKKL
ncbi:hypothetical protein MRB53_015550 [Persea americana]|uniref:Uncharacterized protein n=1 Tax=Persea americana TaxID=3435 RepID=A0ACC2M0K4_PERAE|nr:hypothetical protein MRB53_015550 [Persea americana]